MKIICTGDWHCGAKAFHREAAEGIIDRVKREKKTYMLFLGDAIEGKKIDSPHFDPSTLDSKQISIQQQYRYFRDLITPVKNKILCLNQGNHDRYIARNFNYLEELGERTGIPIGGYQTLVEVHPGLLVFMFHGWRGMPRGAKDPIQREGNRRAWLKRELEELSGSAHVMLMGHTHHLLVQPPTEQYTLLRHPGGKDVRAAFFTEPEALVDTEHGALPWVPERARWYGNTGTMRRSGGFGYVDYSEIAGYSPSPIGHLEMTVEGGRCVGLERVIV
jgi:predicted phosphodiesterase